MKYLKKMRNMLKEKKKKHGNKTSHGNPLIKSDGLWQEYDIGLIFSINNSNINLMA